MRGSRSREESKNYSPGTTNLTVAGGREEEDGDDSGGGGCSNGKMARVSAGARRLGLKQGKGEGQGRFFTYPEALWPTGGRRCGDAVHGGQPELEQQWEKGGIGSDVRGLLMGGPGERKRG